tara:strand:- start:324 stop:2837 length:2514 start_codon:yes stop_codon:yes gene_type:complete
MSFEKTLGHYPAQISRPFITYTKAEDEGAMHKALLDLGESFLTYLVGIMFGEYKRSGEISDRLESEFYKFSSRQPSFGVFLSFMRMLSKEMKDTIIADKFEKGKKYQSVSEFIFEFSLLKQVINEGADEEFTDNVETLKKGKSVGQKGLMDFFDTFIMIRNIYAHPEEKAGPKDAKRKWPLEDEYYSYINPLMHAALSELIADFDILKSYKPVVAKMLDDKNKKGTFLLEMGEKEQELSMGLTIDDLRFMNTDLRYLLDSEDKLFVKLYYHAIPQLNPEVAKKIIDRDKAKAMEPYLEEMINGKLVNDEKIDDLEYLILRDTAKTSAISDERLFQLIDKVKNRLGLKGKVGTPDNKGDLFIEAKEKKSGSSFNPWWLHYFSMVGKIDKNIVKTEQAQEKKLGKAIKTLKESKKSLPVMKRLANAKLKLKEKKVQKSKQINNLNEKIKAKRETRKKTNNTDRKKTLLADIEGLKNKLDEKREYFEAQIDELTMAVNEIEKVKDEKTKEKDAKISSLVTELDEHSRFTQWGMHKNLWKEIDQYIDHLLDENLNTGTLESDEEDVETASKWVNSPNAWQIGNLSYIYWAKIHPSEAPLGMTYNVGYALANRFKWVPKNIDDSLVETLKKPASVLWTTQDDKWAAKIDLDGSLKRRKNELDKELLDNYTQELLDLGANVKCGPIDIGDDVDADKVGHFMPLEKFLEVNNEFHIQSIYSRIWPIDAFYNNGKLVFDALDRYERETVTMLQLFTNVIVQLNDFALANGINQETIIERFDQFNRMKEILYLEFAKKYPEGTIFKPTKEELQQWREFAKLELRLSDYLYDMILAKYRFSSRYKAV